VEYGGDGEPDALIVSDLPMQGDSRERSRQQVDAIRTVLEDRHWSAGQTAVAFEACDDSIAKTGEWDAATCRSNAQAYADDAEVVAVIGTYNSGCAAEIIPILNQAKDGPVAMVSPGNTFVCLTEPADTCKPSEPGTYYPTGKRNYVRVVPNDAAQAAGLADFSRKEGVSRPFVLYAAHDPTSTGQATAYRNAARAAGLEVSGFERWDPKAKDYAKLLQQVRSPGADAVILAGLLEENGAQLIEDKVSVLGPNDDVKLLAFDGFAQQSTIDDAGKAAAGMFASVPGRAPENLAGPGKALVGDLEEQGDRPVELFAPYARQAAEVVLDTVAQNGTGRGAVASGLFTRRYVTGSRAASTSSEAATRVWRRSRSRSPRPASSHSTR